MTEAAHAVAILLLFIALVVFAVELKNILAELRSLRVVVNELRAATTSRQSLARQQRTYGSAPRLDRPVTHDRSDIETTTARQSMIRRPREGGDDGLDPDR